MVSEALVNKGAGVGGAEGDESGFEKQRGVYGDWAEWGQMAVRGIDLGRLARLTSELRIMLWDLDIFKC